MLDMALVAQCSPNMQPVIVQAIVKTESSFNPFAIGVNKGAGRLLRQPTNYAQAVQTAKRLLAQGANIDMGLGQINSANMSWLNLSVEQAFTPCSNLKALQHVYQSCYNRAGNTGSDNRMERAFSCYNTGNTRNGFANGYVAKVMSNYHKFAYLVPQQLAKNSYNSPTKIEQNSNNPMKLHISPTDSVQNFSATQVSNDTQNAVIDTVRASDDGFLKQPSPKEKISADDTPVKVHHSWDIFRDF